MQQYKNKNNTTSVLKVVSHAFFHPCIKSKIFMAQQQSHKSLF